MVLFPLSLRSGITYTDVKLSLPPLLYDATPMTTLSMAPPGRVASPSAPTVYSCCQSGAQASSRTPDNRRHPQLASTPAARRIRTRPGSVVAVLRHRSCAAPAARAPATPVPRYRPGHSAAGRPSQRLRGCRPRCAAARSSLGPSLYDGGHPCWLKACDRRHDRSDRRARSASLRTGLISAACRRT